MDDVLIKSPLSDDLNRRFDKFYSKHKQSYYKSLWTNVSTPIPVAP